MKKLDPSMAQQVAEAVSVFQQRRTGYPKQGMRVARMNSLMPAFDRPVQRPSAEVAAATEAADRFPTDAALIVHGQQQRFKRIAATSRSHPEELAAMVLELQSNRAILDGLADWYGVFVFTGGHAPTAEWNLVALTSYLEHPLAAGCPCTSEIERYRHLAQAINELGQAGAGPRTLRCRHDLGEKFGQAASEIRVLTNTLESSVTKAMEELGVFTGG